MCSVKGMYLEGLFKRSASGGQRFHRLQKLIDIRAALKLVAVDPCRQVLNLYHVDFTSLKAGDFSQATIIIIL